MQADQSQGHPQDQAQGQAQSLYEVTLSGAIALAKEGKNYEQASAQFEALVGQLEADSARADSTGANRSEASKLLKMLWKEYVSVQRSAVFYESLSEAEAGLSEKMAESTIQLKRNYMRLIQEQ